MLKRSQSRPRFCLFLALFNHQKTPLACVQNGIGSLGMISKGIYLGRRK